jgi:hypothetical protein
MAVVLVRIMTTITGIPQQQEKPLMLFQTVLTLIFAGSTPAKKTMTPWILLTMVRYLVTTR